MKRISVGGGLAIALRNQANETCNDLSSFSDLPKKLQEEALREGEERLKSQLAVATAADARALAWGGLLVASVTAAIGAAVAMISKETPDYILATVALVFAGYMSRAARTALTTVVPKKWHFPGNTPAHWIPEEWECVGDDGNKSKQARLDQARALSNAIEQNSRLAAKRGEQMVNSFESAISTIQLAGLILFGVLAFKYASLVAAGG